MPEERDVNKIYKWKLVVSRPVGHPKVRWKDNEMKDIQALKIVNWKKCAQDRNKWKSTGVNVAKELGFGSEQGKDVFVFTAASRLHL
jgi:hypothetical protein